MFPQIRGTFLGGPMVRIVVRWGLRWGLLILANYHVGFGVLGVGIYEVCLNNWAAP